MKFSNVCTCPRSPITYEYENCVMNFALIIFCSVTKLSFVLGLFYASQTRYEGIQILIGFIVLVSIKLREMLTGNPTDPFKEPQAAIWSILACDHHQECKQSQQKEANEHTEEGRSYEERKDAQLGPEEEVQSEMQKDIQSDEQGGGKGNCDDIDSVEQSKEAEDFAEGSGAETEFGKTEDLQPAAGCRRRGVSSTQVASSIGCTSGSSQKDGEDTDKTS